MTLFKIMVKLNTFVKEYFTTVPLALIGGLLVFSLPSWNRIRVGSCLENEEVSILCLKLQNGYTVKPV